MYQATRENTNEPFGNVTSLGPGVNSALEDAIPRLTPDGLTMVFQRNEGEFIEGMPYLSPDWPAPGSKLYFSSNSVSGIVLADMFQATWVPEPSAMVLAIVGLMALRIRTMVVSGPT